MNKDKTIEACVEEIARELMEVATETGMLVTVTANADNAVPSLSWHAAKDGKTQFHKALRGEEVQA